MHIAIYLDHEFFEAEVSVCTAPGTLGPDPWLRSDGMTEKSVLNREKRYVQTDTINSTNDMKFRCSCLLGVSKKLPIKPNSISSVWLSIREKYCSDMLIFLKCKDNAFIVPMLGLFSFSINSNPNGIFKLKKMNPPDSQSKQAAGELFRDCLNRKTAQIFSMQILICIGGRRKV